MRILPMFSPVNMALSASGARSTPSKMCSRHTSFSSVTHVPSCSAISCDPSVLADVRGLLIFLNPGSYEIDEVKAA